MVPLALDIPYKVNSVLVKQADRNLILKKSKLVRQIFGFSALLLNRIPKLVIDAASELSFKRAHFSFSLF